MAGVTRGQSETVGVVLLTAVIVVVTVIAGVFLLADFGGTEDTDRVDLDISPTATGVVIENQGGETLDPGEVTVVVRNDSTEQQLNLETYFTPANGDENRFAPGDRWEQLDGTDREGETEVLVVDDDAGRVIEEESAVVGVVGLQLDVDSTRIGDESTTEYTVSQTFEQRESKDVTDKATVGAENETVLELDKSANELVGNKTGTTTVAASFDGESSAPIEVEVVEEGSVVVTDFEHDNPVTPGEILNLTVTVENPGGTEATDELTLERKLPLPNENVTEPIDESISVTLSPGETEAVEFEYEIRERDAQADPFSLRAVTGEDVEGIAQEITTALPTPDLQIDEIAIDTEQPIVGSDIGVSVTVTNEGDAKATDKSLFVTLDGVQDDVSIEPLPKGESTVVKSTVTPVEAGTGDLTVDTGDDSSETEIPVLEPVSFDVTSVRMLNEEPIVVGDLIEINATITNTGEISGEQNIELTSSELSEIDTATSEQTLKLDPGEQGYVELSAETVASGSGEIMVETADDTNATGVEILEPALFEVDITDVTDDLTSGELLTVDAEITNTGDLEDTQTIELGFDSFDEFILQNGQKELTLGPGEEDGVTLEATIDEPDSGQVTVASEDDSDSESVTVEPGATGVLIDPETGVNAGEVLEVDVEVGTLGAVGSTVELYVDDTDGDPVDSETFFFTTQGTLEWSTSLADVGDSLLIAEGPISDNEAQVTLLEPEFTVSELDAPTQTRPTDTIGASGAVETNTDGEVEPTFELRLGEALTGVEGDDYTVLDEETITVSSENPTTVDFEDVTIPESAEQGEQNIGIFRDDDGIEQSIELFDESTEILDDSGEGDLDTDGDLVVPDGVTVDGEVDVGGSVVVGEDATVNDELEAAGDVSVRDNASVTDDLEADGNVEIGNGTTVEGEIESDEGSVSIEDNSTVIDDVDAEENIAIGKRTTIEGEIESDEDSVTIGAESTVMDDIDAEGDVVLGQGATVVGDVDSGAAILLREDATVNGDASAEGEVILEDGASVDGEVDEG